MHVSTHFTDINKPKENHTFPNHNRYHSAIGSHPERVKNLYFLYAAVLRAINRAEPILRAYQYETQVDPELDGETLSLANQLLDITLTNCE
jgi:ERO1-like protein alpha